jgi:hypothetical protein
MSNKLEGKLLEWKVDIAPPSCHQFEKPHQEHPDLNNFSHVEVKYETSMNNTCYCSSKGIAKPKVLDPSSKMSLSTDTEQPNAQENVCDHYSVIVHNAKLKQDITVTDDGSFKNSSVKKKTF